MAACVLFKEINELFFRKPCTGCITIVRPRLVPAARNLPNGGDTSRVAMSPIVSTACAYGSSPNGGDTARIVERSERKHGVTDLRTDAE